MYMYIYIRSIYMWVTFYKKGILLLLLLLELQGMNE